MTLRAGLEPFRLPLKSALVTGRSRIRHRAGFLVRLEDGDGNIGWGEACPLPGWSSPGVAATGTALRQALDEINTAGDGLAAGGGGSPRNSAGRSAEADIMVGVSDSLVDFPHARAAVVGAWHDLQALRAGLPLARLFSDHPARSVAVNALITAVSPADVETAAAAAVEAGFGCLKLKVGSATPGYDIERVRAARAAAGAGIGLRIDANGGWGHSQAVEVLQRLEPLDIALCEEPVAGGVEAIAAVAGAAGVPLAADESVRNEADAARAIELGLDALVLKPQAFGGADRVMTVAPRALAAGIEVLVTSFIDSAVGLTHALHVAAAIDALAIGAGRVPGAHGLATAALLATDVAEPPAVSAGRIDLPEAAGLGISLATRRGAGPG